jgi:hypothetical protein
MALKNTKLAKVGGLLNSTNGQANGFAHMQLVQSANPLPFPTRIAGEDPTWQSRYQAYLQSIQIEQHYGQEWE